MTAKVFTPGETATILTNRLGTLRSWERFLAHCIQGTEGGPGKLGGLTLLPCGYDQCGRNRRPRYAARDIAAFITAVWRLKPATRGPHEPGRYTTTDLDDGRPWQMRCLAKRITGHLRTTH